MNLKDADPFLLEGTASPTGPLAGVRVLDLTSNVLGPLATQTLGDMGADVIKIESPEGDAMRNNGPGRHPGMSAFFMNMNRNKRSVVLNLKTPAAREALMLMVAKADIVVHSMRAQAATRLGLDYGTLSERNPRIIFAYAPGYRADGRHANRPAFDDVIQGESGLVDLVHRATGDVGFLPTVLADKLCGVMLASALGMALYARERSGRGQEVQVPMLESMLSFNLVEHLWTGAFGTEEGQFGYVRALSRHRKPYATTDGHICVMAVDDPQWKLLFQALGRAELIQDERYCSMVARSKNIDSLYALIAEEIGKRSTAEWRARFDAHDVPNGDVQRLDDLPKNPYLVESGFFVHYEHPSEGLLTTTSIPVRFSATPPSMRRGPPRLGEHTRELLKELMLDDAAIEALGGAAP